MILDDLRKYLRPGLPQTTFCPGCGHGLLMGSLLRAVDSLDLELDNVVFVSGIGCAAWIPSPHINADTLHTLHGRAVACATGVKLANPRLTVIVVSGDGDLSSIGGNHLIHAARRDLDLTVICANNQIYGMTGGQTASTTPVGRITSTAPRGNQYRPFDLVSLVRAAGASFAARWPASRPIDLTRSIRRAITTPSFAYVECLSPCTTHVGRYARIPGGIKGLYEHLEGLCVERGEADSVPPDDTFERLVIGEWSDD